MKLILATMLAAFSIFKFTQTSKVLENESMVSKIIYMEQKYAVYLPPYYETSQRYYPVLYLLQGSGDVQSGWVQFGEVKRIADKAISEGKATPMVIIMPDANTGQKGYFNEIVGDWHYKDFFLEEFIPFVEDKYRIRKEKQYRNVAGLSRGGESTFVYALHRPGLYSSTCPLRAATVPLTLRGY